MKKQIILLFIVLASFANTNQIQAQGDEPILGEIVMFAGNFAPRGWALCEGQLLAISQNDALFSLLGTVYGGDGRTTFGLPDLRGRVSIGPGQGPGLPSYSWGQKGGENNNKDIRNGCSEIGCQLALQNNIDRAHALCSCFRPAEWE